MANSYSCWSSVYLNSLDNNSNSKNIQPRYNEFNSLTKNDNDTFKKDIEFHPRTVTHAQSIRDDDEKGKYHSMGIHDTRVSEPKYYGSLSPNFERVRTERINMEALLKENEWLKNEMNTYKDISKRKLNSFQEKLDYELKLMITERDEMHSVLEESLDKNQNLQKTITSLREENEKLKKINLNLESKNARSEASKRDDDIAQILNEYLNDNKMLKLKNTSLLQEIEQLKKLNQNLENSRYTDSGISRRYMDDTNDEALAVLRSKVDELEREKKNFETKIWGLEIDIQKKQEAIIKIRENYKSTNEDMEKFNRIKLENISQKSQLKNLGEDLECAKVNIKQKDDQISQLNNDIRKLKAENSNLKMLCFAQKPKESVLENIYKTEDREEEISKDFPSWWQSHMKEPTPPSQTNLYSFNSYENYDRNSSNEDSL